MSSRYVVCLRRSPQATSEAVFCCSHAGPPAAAAAHLWLMLGVGRRSGVPLGRISIHGGAPLLLFLQRVNPFLSDRAIPQYTTDGSPV